ncbi:MAG: metallophosphoesterase [Lachnospiraceae bacterium]|nr:metallophosphoesterase [Lachnospiraceae bacterium]
MMKLKKLIPWMAAAAAIAGGLFFLRSEYERDQLVTDHFTIRSSKIKGKGKRIVFLTDLHDKEFGPDNERLLQAIREAKPDLVLVGGDMMVAKGVGDLTLSLKFLKQLSEEFTVICANGNHELRLRNEKETYGNKYREYRQALNEMGITFLSDQKIALDEDIELYGACNLASVFFYKCRSFLSSKGRKCACNYKCEAFKGITHGFVGCKALHIYSG